MAGIKVGDRVHVAGFGAGGNTATVVEVLDRCPKAGCYKPALRVRRDPGCFPTWGSDVGLWHQEDAVGYGRAGRLPCGSLRHHEAHEWTGQTTGQTFICSGQPPTFPERSQLADRRLHEESNGITDSWREDQ